MRHIYFGDGLDDWHESLVLLVVSLVPVAMVLALAPEAHVIATVAGVAGLVAGLLLMVASVMFYLRWRTIPDPRQGWVVAALALVTCQVLLNAGFALSPRPGIDPRSGWPILVGATTTILALALAIAGVRARSARIPNPLVLGVTLGIAAALFRLVVVPLREPINDWLVVVLAACVALGHVGIGAAVLANRTLPRWASWRLAATLVLIGIGHVASLGPFDGVTADLVSASARAAAGVLWTSATYVMLRESLESQRVRAAALEGSLLEVEATARGARERLHEVKSTLAGLSSAAQLLNDNTLPDGVRQRLERTIRSELARLERLVTSRTGEPGQVDLDETLDVISELHRARGRVVEWEPSGAHVLGEPDALAEAVNILLENAATHGQGPSHIEVESCDDADGLVQIRVSDHGPGIPEDLRNRVFDWGVGREDSPGQGIGLNLARRLVTEQGGTLTLAEPGDDGSSFVIRLPAVRRSSENHE